MRNPDQTPPPHQARPTIKDVARVAGVHFTTVSMALRGNPRIPAHTRDRIVAAAARLGYERNEVFAALSRQRPNGWQRAGFSPGIAYVTNESVERGLFRTAHHRRLVRGARRQAEELGYRFDLLSIDRGAFTSRSLRRELTKRHLGGIIIGAFFPGRATIDFDVGDISIVKIDSRHILPRSTFVSNDQMHAVRLAFQQLRGLGYRRIGMAVGELDEAASDGLHVAGWSVEQARVPSGERVPPLLFPPGTIDPRVVVRLMRAWIRSHQPDAVLCNWTNVRRLIHDAGYRCPGEVACACLCLSQKLPGLAGIVANLEHVGKRAVNLLADLMRAERRGELPSPCTTYVQGAWTDGPSAPARR